MAKATEILVAAQTLYGGAVTKGNKQEVAVLADGEELTTAKAKALGLSKDDITALEERGVLKQVSVRATGSSGGNSKALQVMTERAETAEGALKELQAKHDALQAQIDTAQAEAGGGAASDPDQSAG